MNLHNIHDIGLAAEQTRKEMYREVENARIVRELKSSQRDVRRSLRYRLGYALITLGCRLLYDYEPKKSQEQM